MEKYAPLVCAILAIIGLILLGQVSTTGMILSYGPDQHNKGVEAGKAIANTCLDSKLEAGYCCGVECGQVCEGKKDCFRPCKYLCLEKNAAVLSIG